MLGLEINIHCLPRSLNGFLLYFVQSLFTEMKSTCIKLQNEPLLKAIDQGLLIINNSVLHVPFSSSP